MCLQLDVHLEALSRLCNVDIMYIVYEYKHIGFRDNPTTVQHIVLVLPFSHEVGRIQSANLARAAVLSPFFSSGKLIVFLTFLSYTMLGYRLTADTIFTVVGLFNPVRLVMTLFLPYVITLSSETWVTLNRLQVCICPKFCVFKKK